MVAEVRSMSTALAAEGSKARDLGAERVVKVLPSVLPSTPTPSERASQPVGSFSATRSTLTAAPRSICTHWGNEPTGPSQ